MGLKIITQTFIHKLRSIYWTWKLKQTIPLLWWTKDEQLPGYRWATLTLSYNSTPKEFQDQLRKEFGNGVEFLPLTYKMREYELYLSKRTIKIVEKKIDFGTHRHQDMGGRPTDADKLIVGHSMRTTSPVERTNTRGDEISHQELNMRMTYASMAARIDDEHGQVVPCRPSHRHLDQGDDRQCTPSYSHHSHSHDSSPSTSSDSSISSDSGTSSGSCD